MASAKVGRRKYIRTICGVVIGFAVGSALGYFMPRNYPTNVGKKILLVFSYHPEYPWQMSETKGVGEVLWNKGFLIENFYMDTKRKTSLDWMKKAAEDAIEKIAEFKPDLVIVFDDNACEFVAKRYIGRTIPFVFCGMNGNPEDYGFPTENITGVIERHYVKETTTLLKRLVPDINKIAMIMDDSSTSRGLINNLKVNSLTNEISEIYTTNDFDDWKARVEELQTKVDAIGLFQYHTIKERGREESLPPEDVLRWTLENNRLPEFGLFDFTIEEGALCGVTQSGEEQGRAAAEIAVKILEGIKPKDIPIKNPKKGIPIINIKRAESLNIKIPEDVFEEVEITY